MLHIVLNEQDEPNCSALSIDNLVPVLTNERTESELFNSPCSETESDIPNLNSPTTDKPLPTFVFLLRLTVDPAWRPANTETVSPNLVFALTERFEPKAANSNTE
jgi:hypothetical protein